MTPKVRGGKVVVCTVRGCEHPVEAEALADLCPFHIKPIWPLGDKVLGETENARLVCNGDTHRGVDKTTGADYRVCDCDCALRNRPDSVARPDAPSEGRRGVQCESVSVHGAPAGTEDKGGRNMDASPANMTGKGE